VQRLVRRHGALVLLTRWRRRLAAAAVAGHRAQSLQTAYGACVCSQRVSALASANQT
jgi:hypothetical protein